MARRPRATRPPCVQERTRHYLKAISHGAVTWLFCPFCHTEIHFDNGPRGGTVERVETGPGSGQPLKWKMERGAPITMEG